MPDDQPEVGSTDFNSSHGGTSSVLTADPSTQQPHAPKSAGKRRKITTAIKYLIAIPVFLFGFMFFLIAVSPKQSPTWQSALFAAAVSATFIIPPLWFFGWEIVDRKFKKESLGKRRWWIPSLLALASFATFATLPADKGGDISRVGDFRDIVSAHADAQEKCLDRVINHAKYPASSVFGEGHSSITVSSAGDGALHKFAGIVNFANGFGVLSEYSYTCEYSQERGFSSAPTSDATLRQDEIDVKEKRWYFFPDMEIFPGAEYTDVGLSDLRGLKNMEVLPDAVYISQGRFAQLKE